MLHLSNKYHLVRWAAIASLFVALCFVGTACSDSDTPLPEEYVTLRVKILTGAENQFSRAVDPDYYEPGSGEFETISTLRIIITRPGDSGSREVVANKLVATSADGYPLDKLEFKVLGNYRYRIYLIANEDILPNPDKNFPTTRAFLDSFEENDILNTTVLRNWTVAAPAVAPVMTGNIFSNINNAQPGMPLTEVFDLDVTIVKSVSEDQPAVSVENVFDAHLFLTRVACKTTFNINVSDDYKAKGVSVTGIMLENIDQSQYVFPRDAQYDPVKNPAQLPAMDDNGSFITTDRYITSFSVPTGENNTLLRYPINLPADSYVPVQAGSKASFGPYYFPETKFENADTRFRVSVRLSDSDAWLPAKPLTDNILVMDGGLQGIARNTHLIVNINFNRPDYPDEPQDNPGGVSITWSAVVAPYNELALFPEFGL